MIRALTNQKQFYTEPDSPFKILKSVETSRVRLTFPLDPFMESHLHLSGMTPI